MHVYVATNTKIQTWKFIMDLQPQPFNSMVKSQRNSLPGHVVIPNSGGRGGNTFSGQQGRKQLHVFLVASNPLVMMKNCACFVHMNTEPGHISHEWT